MDVQVNLWAVLLAGVSAMAVGAVWYSPLLFGAVWRSTVKLDQKQAKREMVPVMVVTFILSLLMAYVLAHVAYVSHKYFTHSFMQDAFGAALWLWLGLAAPAVIINGIFDQRRKKGILLNVGNLLVTLAVMGLIIGWLKP